MMKAAFINLLARRNNDGHDPSYTPTMVGLLVALLVLVTVTLLAVATLYFLRSRRRSREQQLPLYEEKGSSAARFSTHRRVAVRPSESIVVYQEKQSLLANSDAPPTTSPVPEIRITFPEEIDDAGKRQSGRVVVVRVGEHSIGLEPVSEEKLPPYQQDGSDRFQSLDLERIGGLTEKEMEARFS